MNSSLTRREFLVGATALSVTAAPARQAPSSASSTQRVVVRLDDEIGLIRPDSRPIRRASRAQVFVEGPRVRVNVPRLSVLTVTARARA